MFGITFLNSGILLVASAAVIPLLIHFFARRKPRKILFSSLRFIRQSKQRQNRRINLRNLLLLLIRILIILLTVLGIARPAIKLPGLGDSGEHPPTAVALVVDNSYSMDNLNGTMNGLELAKEAVRMIDGMLSKDDITLLLTLDGSWNQLNGTPRSGGVDQRKLNEIQLTPMPLPPDEVISTARDQLAGTHFVNREIYFITDMQETELPQDIEDPVYFIPVAPVAEPVNISCQNAGYVRQLIDKDVEDRIGFQVVNHTGVEQQNVICELVIDGTTVAEQVLDLQPYQRKSGDFPVSIENPGEHWGYVRVRNERLPYDDRSWFTFRVLEDMRIAVLTQRTRLPLPLSTILEVYSEDSGLDFPDGNPTLEQLGEYNAVVFYDVPWSGRVKFLLDRLPEQGTGTLIVADSTLSGAWQSDLSARFGIQFEGFESGRGRRVTEFNQYHPVTEIFDGEKSGQTDVSGFWRTKAAGTGATTLLGTGEMPLAMEDSGIILWLFDPAFPRGRFFLDPVYPVFAFRTMQRLTRQEDQQAAQVVGDRVQLSPGTLIYPDGTARQLTDGTFTPRQAGIYRLEGRDEMFAVNLRYDESDWKPLQIPDGSAIHGTSPEPSQWKQEILRTRYGFEVWEYLFVLALILLLLEMLIVRLTERKSAKATTGDGA